MRYTLEDKCEILKERLRETENELYSTGNKSDSPLQRNDG